jgi:chromosomal replication initiation ATPase DnaA
MDGLWNHCLRHFEKKLPPQQFRTWIQPLQAASHGQILTIGAQSFRAAMGQRPLSASNQQLARKP